VILSNSLRKIPVFQVKSPVIWNSLLICLISLFLLAACSSPPPANSNSNKTLTVGISPWPGFAGIYTAMDKNFFKAEGVDVKEVNFQAGSDANTAFLAGRLDLVWTGVPDMVVMAGKDSSIKLLMLSDYSNGADGILGRNITKPQDVKGKKVAMESQFIEFLLLRKYLEKAGLTQKDVTLVEMPAADAASSFAAGKIDVAVTYEPWMTKVAKQGQGEIIFTSKSTNIIPDGLAAREKLIQERRADILTYMRAVDKGVKLAKEKPEQTKGMVAKRLGISPQEVSQQVSGARLFDIETNKSVVFNPNSPLNVVDSSKFAAKTAKELKFTPNLIDSKTVYDDSPIKSL